MGAGCWNWSATSSESGNQKSRSRYSTITSDINNNASAVNMSRRCFGSLDANVPGNKWRFWSCDLAGSNIVPTLSAQMTEHSMPQKTRKTNRKAQKR